MKYVQGYENGGQREKPFYTLLVSDEGETRGHSSKCTIKVNRTAGEVLSSQSSLGKGRDWLGCVRFGI